MATSSASVLCTRLRRQLSLCFDAASRSGDHVVAGMPAEAHALTLAAVLVPLIERDEGVTVLLTRRTEHLKHHGGQVSFPGGRVEPTDASPIDAALREAREEVGLRSEQIEVLGQLIHYQTITRFLVAPVVGLVTPPVNLRPDPDEVAEIFEVPLDIVLDTRNYQRHSRLIRGRCRYYYVLNYREHLIWGATAAMLLDLARVLNTGQQLD